MKKPLILLGLAAVLGANSCVGVKGEKMRNGVREEWIGVTPYFHLGSNDAPVVVAGPYYSPYYRPYYSSYRYYGSGYRYYPSSYRSYSSGYHPPPVQRRTIGHFEVRIKRD